MTVTVEIVSPRAPPLLLNPIATRYVLGNRQRYVAQEIDFQYTRKGLVLVHHPLLSLGDRRVPHLWQLNPLAQVPRKLDYLQDGSILDAFSKF